MRDYEQLLQRLAEENGGSFRPAASEDLAALEPFHLPHSVLEYFRQFEPVDYPGGAAATLHNIKHLLKENSGSAIPGGYTVKHGFFVFATTGCGDCYCFDCRRLDEGDVPIVLFPHELISERTPVERILQLAKPVASDLYDFLHRLLNEELDEMPLD
jgi:hypothetical protein